MGEFLPLSAYSVGMNTVLLADSHTLTRSALALLLRTRLEFDDIQTAASWMELLRSVELHRPRLVMLDWGLPGLEPQAGLTALRQLHPQAVVIALSARPETRWMALDLGVEAFVSKLESPDRLMETVQQLMAPGLLAA